MLLPNERQALLSEAYPVSTVVAAAGLLPNHSASLIKPPKVLLVDDNDNDLFLMRRSLETQNCDVISAKSVTEALQQIATQSFDVLITDLHMPAPGDGFAVVTAMRHSQPEALTLVVSDHPDVQKAMNAIILQADEVLMKPFDVKRLAGLMDKNRLTSLPFSKPVKEGVACILDRDVSILMQRWLERVEQVKDLAAIPLAANERTKYLPDMIGSISARLRLARTIQATDSPIPAAVTHGQYRYRQGYTAPLIVQEAQLLQVSIFETIQRNLASVDFTAVLADIMIVADQVDSHLKQSIGSFLAAQRKGEALAAAGIANAPCSAKTN